MKFFCDCKSQDEVKVLFRKLAKMLHPDHGGSSEMMIELQKQHDEWNPSSKSESMAEDVLNKAYEGFSETYRGYGKPRYPFGAPSGWNQRSEHEFQTKVNSLELQINMFQQTIKSLQSENQRIASKFFNVNENCNRLMKMNDDLIVEIKEKKDQIEDFIRQTEHMNHLFSTIKQKTLWQLIKSYFV